MDEPEEFCVSDIHPWSLANVLHVRQVFADHFIRLWLVLAEKFAHRGCDAEGDFGHPGIVERFWCVGGLVVGEIANCKMNIANWLLRILI